MGFLQLFRMQFLLGMMCLAMPLLSQGQILNHVSDLDPSVVESSGLIHIDGHLITHNDSGDEPKLYVLDPIDGSVLHTTVITGAEHIDWEDITHDEDYIYIGDFGNNEGSRQDLVIYRIPLDDAWSQESIAAERIEISYAEQVSFSPAPFSTNYDAEALISYGDSLYIFSKNWGDARTNLYACPKLPGTYTLNRIDSLDSQGYVTGATYNEDTDEVMLCGYTVAQAFVIAITDFNPGELVSSTVVRTVVDPINSSYQVEAVTDREGEAYLLSTEQGFSGVATLQVLVPDSTISLPELSPVLGKVFPNPSSGQVHVRHAQRSLTEIYSDRGQFVRAYRRADFSVSDLAPGLYHLIMRDEKEAMIGSFEMIVE
jgi:hypothetical protein